MRAERDVAVRYGHLAPQIGRRVRRRRQSFGLTQKQVAGDVYTAAYISAIECGLLFPSIPALAFLADQLHCSPAWLLVPE